MPRKKAPSSPSSDRPHGQWVIYSHWLLLIFNSEFLVWLLLFITFEVGMIYVYVMGIFRHFAVPILMAAAFIYFVIRWSRQFLVRMVVDYDANNGDGRILIQRLVPSPNLPETVQFPLQQAAEGSPEVNTKGILNTLISQVKTLKFLRPFTIGDLTLRGPAAPFGITMYNIKDPGGVKAKLEQDWKKILAIKNKEKAEKEKKEEIERFKEGVRLGIIEAYKTFKEDGLLNPPAPPPVAILTPPVVLKEEPEPMEGVEDLPEGGEGGHGEEAPGGAETPLGSTSIEGGGGEGGGEGGGAPAA